MDDKAVMTSVVFVDLKSDITNCLLRTSDRRINIGGDYSMTAGRTWKRLYLILIFTTSSLHIAESISDSIHLQYILCFII